MIYVDDAMIAATVARVSSKWSHLFSYPVNDINVEELHEFAAQVGMKRSWFQGPPKHRLPHYDLTVGKRQVALRLGAIPVSYWGDLPDIMKGTWGGTSGR